MFYALKCSPGASQRLRRDTAPSTYSSLWLQRLLQFSHRHFTVSHFSLFFWSLFLVLRQTQYLQNSLHKKVFENMMSKNGSFIFKLFVKQKGFWIIFMPNYTSLCVCVCVSFSVSVSVSLSLSLHNLLSHHNLPPLNHDSYLLTVL